MSEHELSRADTEMLEWLDVFQESDRGMVVQSGSIIDSLLEEVITTRIASGALVPRKSRRFLNDKRELALTNDWIGPDTANDIQIIGKIRNSFAHERFAPTFHDDGIQDQIRLLRTPLRSYEEHELVDLHRTDHKFIVAHFESELTAEADPQPLARLVYLTALHMVYCDLGEAIAESRKGKQ